MSDTPLHDDIRRTAAGLMALLDIEEAGEQLVRLYGEQAVADALTPVAQAVRAGATTPSVDRPTTSPQLALMGGDVRVIRRKAADQSPRGRVSLLALSRPWTPQDRAAKGAAPHDWL